MGHSPETPLPIHHFIGQLGPLNDLGFFVVETLCLSTLFIHILIPTCTGFEQFSKFICKTETKFVSFKYLISQIFVSIFLDFNFIRVNYLITISSPDDTLSKPASARFKGRLNLLHH